MVNWTAPGTEAMAGLAIVATSGAIAAGHGVPSILPCESRILPAIGSRKMSAMIDETYPPRSPRQTAPVSLPFVEFGALIALALAGLF